MFNHWILLRIWHWRVGHKWKFQYNIYGDAIMYHNWNRSVYKCETCNKIKWCPGLDYSEIENEIRRLQNKKL